MQGWSSKHETQQDGDNLLGVPFPRILFIVVQMSCSVLASVYNETLLKKTSVSPHLQNLCLCLNSIAANVIIGVIARATCIRKCGDVDLLGDLQLLVLSPQNVAVVLTLAIAGIMSSMVLRYENSVTKGVASATEVIFTTMIEYMMGSNVMISDFMAATLVAFGTILYSCPTEDQETPRGGRVWSLSFCFRFILLMSMFSFGAIFPTMHFHRSFADWLPNDISFDESKLEAHAPLCTGDIVMNQTRPKEVRRIKYQRNLASHRVLAFVVEALDGYGIPVAIMYGTLLHEYRNGTGDCVLHRLDDKDLDIAIFKHHIPLVLDMNKELEEKFGWTIGFKDVAKGYLQIHPFDDRRKEKKVPDQVSFQIDVYGFSCDEERRMLNFEWDRAAVSMNGFLPLTRHKTVMDRTSYLHIPFDPACLLANMYGPDYMTPKKTKYFRTKAHDDPRCHSSLNADQEKEFERQLEFCKPVEIEAREEANKTIEYNAGGYSHGRVRIPGG